jgi:hypothetical protein
LDLLRIVLLQGAFYQHFLRGQLVTVQASLSRQGADRTRRCCIAT